MQRVNVKGLNLWQFDLLKNQPGLKHFITDRVANEELKNLP